MIHPKALSILDFTYDLPQEKIAFHPLANRQDSKLLIYKNGTIKESVYKNIAAEIPSDALVVFNNTKVIEARLHFQKPSGGMIEIFCLEPGSIYPDISTALLQETKVEWHCLVGGASKWKPDVILQKIVPLGSGEQLILSAKCIGKTHTHYIIEFCWNAPITFAELLHQAGAIPLPPYIKRTAELTDKERYQTVFAHFEGSVAAPTAGLHFTKEILTDLTAKNITQEYVTLHVGAGTFKPVKAHKMEEHDMHAEYFSVKKEALYSILKKEAIVAVGTTSLRTIESLYWLGVHYLNTGEIKDVSQWEPYETTRLFTKEESINGLLTYLDKKNLQILQAKTQIIIAPGYIPRIANGLVTNFHQPQSTLLLLVAAFINEDWRKVYNYALQNNFRFLSYGDGSLLWFNS